MPGSVALAAPSTVLPNTLCSAFEEVRAFATRENGYPNGDYQAAAVSTTARRQWALGKRLTVAQWETLRQFFVARKGPLQPLYWYPLRSQYDASGASTTGRITVRFDGSLSRTYEMGRQGVSLRLIEIA